MSKIEYGQTKKHSLINATTAVRSKELQSYLLNLFPSLKIREWVRNATVHHSSSVAATVFEQICYKLYHILHDQSEPSTDCTVSMGNGMNGLYSQNPQMYGGSIVTVPSQSQPSTMTAVANNMNNHTLYTAQNQFNFNPQMYGGMHSMRNTVTSMAQCFVIESIICFGLVLLVFIYFKQTHFTVNRAQCVWEIIEITNSNHRIYG